MHSDLVQTGSYIYIYMEIVCHLKKIEQDTETRTSRFIFVCHDFIIKKLQALLSRSESR